MTAAQQKSRERFKKAIAEAKKLRKKNPKLSQAQAVKQAWAILYSSGKVSGIKKQAKKAPVKKKAAVKKSSYHKDTKSHNVNIRVISGIDKQEIINKIIRSNKYIDLYKEYINKWKKIKPESISEKKLKAKELKEWNKMLKNEIEYINKLKKHI